MRNKIINVAIVIFVLIIILTSFIVPDLIFSMQYNNVEIQISEARKRKNNVSVEAEKIYLVKAMHMIDKSYNDYVDIGNKYKYISSKLLIKEVDPENIISLDKIEYQLQKLEEYNIIKGVNYDNYSNIAILDKLYEKNNEKCVVHMITMQDKKIEIDIEHQTEKIIYLLFDKSMLSESSQKDILENYVKYLGLDIISDWKFEENKLKSKEAGLEVGLSKTDNWYLLVVYSTKI